MRELLEFIGQQPFSHRFYLAGGTALALQIGHRQSVDLDFFSETDEVSPQTQTVTTQACHFDRREKSLVSNFYLAGRQKK